MAITAAHVARAPRIRLGMVGGGLWFALAGLRADQRKSRD